MVVKNEVFVALSPLSILPTTNVFISQITLDRLSIRQSRIKSLCKTLDYIEVNTVLETHNEPQTRCPAPDDYKDLQNSIPDSPRTQKIIPRGGYLLTQH